MKTSIMLMLISSLFLFAACDDDSDSGPDYEDLCATSCAIDDTCNLLDTLTVAECEAACQEQAVNQLDGFFEAFVACKEDHTCQELSEGGENSTICYDENVEECTTDTTDYLETACTVRLDCDGISEPTTEEMEDCMDTMLADGNVLRCFTPSTLAEATACIADSDSCTPDPVKICVEDVLGLTLGNSSSNTTN